MSSGPASSSCFWKERDRSSRGVPKLTSYLLVCACSEERSNLPETRPTSPGVSPFSPPSSSSPSTCHSFPRSRRSRTHFRLCDPLLLLLFSFDRHHRRTRRRTQHARGRGQVRRRLEVFPKPASACPSPSPSPSSLIFYLTPRYLLSLTDLVDGPLIVRSGRIALPSSFLLPLASRHSLFYPWLASLRPSLSVSRLSALFISLRPLSRSLTNENTKRVLHHLHPFLPPSSLLALFPSHSCLFPPFKNPHPSATVEASTNSPWACSTEQSAPPLGLSRTLTRSRRSGPRRR